MILRGKNHKQGFSDGSVVKNLLANSGDMGSIPDSRGSTRCEATKPVYHNY